MLINLTETLNTELMSKGIKVRVINSGFVKTELTDKNRFRMPFLNSTDKAADYIMRELDTDSFEIAFPKRFVYLMKLLRILPYRAYFVVTRKIRRRQILGDCPQHPLTITQNSLQSRLKSQTWVSLCIFVRKRLFELC